MAKTRTDDDQNEGEDLSVPDSAVQEDHKVQDKSE